MPLAVRRGLLGGGLSRRGGRDDRLVRFEDGLVIVQHPAQGPFGPGRELGRPDLRRPAPQVIFVADPVQPGQRAVDAAEPQVGAEERETDRRLAKQRVQQGGV